MVIFTLANSTAKLQAIATEVTLALATLQYPGYVWQLLQLNKIVNKSTTTETTWKISLDLESSDFKKNCNVDSTKFKNNQILLHKISLWILLTTKTIYFPTAFGSVCVIFWANKIATFTLACNFTHSFLCTHRYCKHLLAPSTFKFMNKLTDYYAIWGCGGYSYKRILV